MDFFLIPHRQNCSSRKMVEAETIINTHIYINTHSLGLDWVLVKVLRTHTHQSPTRVSGWWVEGPYNEGVSGDNTDSLTVDHSG